MTYIKSCENALLFFGGVPEAIVSENLNSAENKASRNEAELNERFAAFAGHYNTHIFPKGAYKPKDRALVEGAVNLYWPVVYKYIHLLK